MPQKRSQPQPEEAPPTDLESLRELPPDALRDLILSLSRAQAEALLFDWHLWAREGQRLPKELPETWLLLAGRGYGKTRAGAEGIRELVTKRKVRRFVFIGTNPRDVRDYMIEGPSGILNIGPRSERPVYEPANLRLLWPQYGAIAYIRSSWDPDGVRGANADVAWCDEICKWKYPRDTYENLDLALREGLAFRIITTTPKPIPLIREIIDDAGTQMVTGTTYENILNLSGRFIRRIIRKYEGTRLGLQELHAKLLDDVEGALWLMAQIEADRITSYGKIPDFERVVVGVDPPGSATGAEAGIVVAAKAARQGFCLDDRSLQGTPAQWGMAAVQAYVGWEADCIVAERNFGGEMVAHTIHTIAPDVPVKLVHASRGKQQRAEPIATKSERHEIHHVGTFAELEGELCSWVPGEKNQASPNRLDGYVWAFSDLFPEDSYTADEVHVF